MAERKAPGLDAPTWLLIGGGVLAVLAYAMLPAVTFTGRGDAAFGLTVFDKKPVMAVLALLAVAAAVAASFVPALSRWRRETAAVAAIAVLVPALWGFVMAIDAWSATRAAILQMAGTRSVRIDPGLAYPTLAAACAMIAVAAWRSGDRTPGAA